MFNTKPERDFRCFYWVCIPYKPLEKESERRVRRAEAREKLKAAGYEESKFHYMNSQKKTLGAAMRKKAEKLAEEIRQATGLEIEVVEGSYL